jgi:hypothetical protein
MKNYTVMILAIILVIVLAYAGVDGILKDHATGPLFIFLALCSATGLTIDINRVVKERVRKNNIKKFGR